MNEAAAHPAPLEARAAAIAAGDRRALARAITLVESTRPDHRAEAEALIERVLPHAGNSIRIGLSGVPGVGKSTFIEAFGLMLIRQGHRVAVLAVDPSSRRTGGSILGDKTRMTELARAEAAFIRPSPSGGTLGGVARRTRESIVLCEAAGFDVILVETVGVGQSETAVADMVDLFCLLLLPSAGDELQGIKKGIVELAELLLVNKADGELEAKARVAVGDYRAALRLLRPLSPLWQPEVLAVSAVTGQGLDAAWAAIERHEAAFEAAGEKARRRAAQAQAALWADLGDGMIEALRRRPAIAGRIPEIEAAVAAGTMTAMAGARRLLALFLGE
ncbi:LAO/AO transport system kinase [Aliidongia dinghuensis]|uniref:LAO/AO transport system kinase n=1 Tax=Aliidongia dinghuensis TaxID=1867774 RepID=A0A8J3E776_9PROT|nr:methylmalonyl Co-A mutase-associated GTPase MeaB [Aliidongia dinghuensis]GGF48974.1 LAO/AO transport system kinase [Aliidongia dinghuensis]